MNAPIQPNNDSRLSKAYEVIDSGQIEVLSVDIFDTLLWRLVPKPIDLFLILGERLKNQGALIEAVSAHNFAKLRVIAETQARCEKQLLSENSEVTLHEIYRKLQSLFVIDETDAINIEIALEKEFTRLDPDIVSLILYAQSKNIPCILVSDTYFKKSEIEEFLNRSRKLSFHTLYISCEHGCSKQHGLFDIIVEDFSSAGKILHIGDNFEGDIKPAKLLGITTLYFLKFNHELEEVLDREWESKFHSKCDLLDTSQGDFGLTSLRTKIVNHTDLTTISKSDQFFWKYGASVLGPILFGFIHWIYDRCFETNETEVLCLMREGKLYANLIKRFGPYYPKHHIEPRELWLSRAFIVHASMGEANAKELIAMVKGLLEQVTVEHFCDYLGLDIKHLGKWFQYRHMMLEDLQLRKEFITFLVTNENLRREIILNAHAKRTRFLNYLSKTTDLSSDRTKILVDVGWNGTAQEAVEKIFRLGGLQPKLHGLYLGTMKAASHALLESQMREGYLIKNGYPYDNVHMKGCFVLEQTATAEMGMGPLHDIGQEGQIITTPSMIPKAQKRQAKAVQQGIFAFFDMMGPYIKSGEIKWDSKSEALQNQLRNVFMRSMGHVTTKEAQKFGPWLHEHAASEHLTQVIGEDEYYERFMKDMLPANAFKEYGLNWPGAYAAKQSENLALVSNVSWMKMIPSECFLSEDQFALKIFLDKGKGFSRRPAKELELRSNPNRCFYALCKINASKQSIEKVRLSLEFPQALVRIKSLRLMVYDRKSPMPQLLTFFESESDSSGMECHCKEQINFNTFYSDESLELIHLLQNDEVYEIKVKLCCEMFKLEEKQNNL